MNFKLMPKIILIFSFYLFNSLSSFSIERGHGTVCNLPVCDIEKLIGELEAADENYRYNYIHKLVTTYKETHDLDILNNLLEVSNALTMLIHKMGDPDWVLRESATLTNNVVVNLIKYSKINAKDNIHLFKKLTTSATRYDILVFFQKELFKIEDILNLYELVEFAQEIYRYLLLIEDESWIARAALELASDISLKIAWLHPEHEGTYDIKLDQDCMLFDKIIIFDSSSEKNLFVDFIDSKFGKVIYSFSDVVLLGNTISGTYISSSGESATFSLKRDRENGNLLGHVSSTRRSKIRFVGSQIYSLAEVHQGQIPYHLTDQNILGVLQGELLGVEGQLIIQSFLPNVYSASFIAKDRSIILDFKGRFFPKAGILSLSYKNLFKLTVSLREIENIILWRGVTLSLHTGFIQSAYFNPIILKKNTIEKSRFNEKGN